MPKSLSTEDRVRIEWRARQCEDSMKDLIRAAKLEENAGNHAQAAALLNLAKGVEDLLASIHARVSEQAQE